MHDRGGSLKLSCYFFGGFKAEISYQLISNAMFLAFENFPVVSVLVPHINISNAAALYGIRVSSATNFKSQYINWWNTNRNAHHEPQLRPTTPALSSIRSIFIVFGIRRNESDLRPLHGVND